MKTNEVRWIWSAVRSAVSSRFGVVITMVNEAKFTVSKTVDAPTDYAIENYLENYHTVAQALGGETDFPTQRKSLTPSQLESISIHIIAKQERTSPDSVRATIQVLDG